MNVSKIIQKIVEGLREIDGIEAIVLGGSRARGDYNVKSDIDIGIYYNDGDHLDMEALGKVATMLDDEHRKAIITDIGEWGPWINGGGWLNIDGVSTDFLFRDLKKVRNVIDDCLNKNIEIYYQPGHPHGFVNSIYSAEVFYCKTLWDPNDLLSELKDMINPYPINIKEGTVNKFLWEADFFIGIAEKSLTKNDAVYTSGCLFRIVSCLIQVVFALNETYIMNEKGALSITDKFVKIPYDFKKRIENIFSQIASEEKQKMKIINELKIIIQETRRLCELDGL